VNIEIVPAEPRHAAIVPYLRRANVEEIWAECALSPAFAVSYSIAYSRVAWAAELDGKPIAVFGVGTGENGAGIPWLVATNEIERHPVLFYRMSKRLFSSVRDGYTYLENWVDARNVLSLRWLKWLGFTIEKEEPRGPLGLMFHRAWFFVEEVNAHVYYRDGAGSCERGGKRNARPGGAERGQRSGRG
jgi:hypothetical protein